MVVSFFESLKYVGHFVPIAFLRIYIGYAIFDRALGRIQGEFLTQPRLAAIINDWLPQSDAPLWYIEFLENFVVPDPNWKIFAYIITYTEMVVGISFLVGFLVRPVALLGATLALSMIYGGGELASLHHTDFALFIVMAWLGAGRCLGFDYFFYKRQRGIWW